MAVLKNDRNIKVRQNRCASKYITGRYISHKSGFVGKTKDYAGRDAQVGCRANARPPLSRYL